MRSAQAGRLDQCIISCSLALRWSFRAAKRLCVVKAVSRPTLAAGYVQFLALAEVFTPGKKAML